MCRFDAHRTEFRNHEIVERYRCGPRGLGIALLLVLLFHLMEDARRRRRRFHRLRPDWVVAFGIDPPALDPAAEAARAFEQRNGLEWFIRAGARVAVEKLQAAIEAGYAAANNCHIHFRWRRAGFVIGFFPRRHKWAAIVSAR